MSDPWLCACGVFNSEGREYCRVCAMKQGMEITTIPPKNSGISEGMRLDGFVKLVIAILAILAFLFLMKGEPRW